MSCAVPAYGAELGRNILNRLHPITARKSASDAHIKRGEFCALNPGQCDQIRVRHLTMTNDVGGDGQER